MELKKADKTAAHCAYCHKDKPSHEAHQALDKVRHKYVEAIESTKKKHWEEWLEELQSEEKWMPTSV